jgi:hypothetical protein
VAFVECIDIAPGHAGAVARAMNTRAQVGVLLSSIGFRYREKSTGSYNTP